MRLAIGPGLGQRPPAHALVDAALAAPCPLVLDADALNLLAGDPELARRAARRTHPTLLTPHPGEAARLLGREWRRHSGEPHRVGPHTEQDLLRRRRAERGGHRHRPPRWPLRHQHQGGPWLAQAGSGDRLTGMVIALLGQGMSAGDALEAAVWLHGRETPTQQIRDFR